MKTKHIPIVIGAAALYASATTGKAQEFQNLDFESPITTLASLTLYGQPVYTLPNWNVSLNGYYNVGYPNGVIYNSPFGVPLDTYYGIIVSGTSALAGNQSLGLGSGNFASTGTISISQTGIIPNGDNSVSFLLGDFGAISQNNGLAPQNPLDYFALSINNQNVPLVVTLENGGVLTVAGNISEWAGQTVTLSLGNAVPNGNVESYGVIDDVTFSPQVVVPESSGIGLLSGAISLSVVFLIRRKLS
jgi:hypothetical protein